MAAPVASPVDLEKPAVPVEVEFTPATSLPVPKTNGFLDPVFDIYRAFQDRRAALGLTSPGPFDQISKEVQRDVLLSGQTFSGLRAELNKSSSMSPLFQVSHAFSAGSQMLSPYTFLAIYGTNNVLLQGQLDSDSSFSARFNTRLTDRLIFKTAVQIQPASMSGPGGAQVSIEQDYTGNDFTASIKSMNPSILDDGLTGMFIGSYLQSITPRLSLGVEGLLQKPGGGMGPEAALSYAGRFKGDNWIATAQLLSQGAIAASYWKRLTDKIETGVDVSLQFAGLNGANAMMGGPSRDGVATLGAKYDFARSVFRAQVDSKGKIGCLLEKAVLPTVKLTFAGEMDHYKNTAKLGLAVSMETSSEDLLMQQEHIQPVMPPF